MAAPLGALLGAAPLGPLPGAASLGASLGAPLGASLGASLEASLGVSLGASLGVSLGPSLLGALLRPPLGEVAKAMEAAAALQTKAASVVAAHQQRAAAQAMPLRLSSTIRSTTLQLVLRHCRCFQLLWRQRGPRLGPPCSRCLHSRQPLCSSPPRGRSCGLAVARPLALVEMAVVAMAAGVAQAAEGVAAAAAVAAASAAQPALQKLALL